MKVSIVILNWNGENFLRKFLPSVIGFSKTTVAEVVVADNASTDNSISILKTEFPDVKILEFDQNYGFAGGYNKALNQIDAEYFILLNSDVEVTENWLQPMVEFMDNNKDVAACQPKILAYNSKQNFEHAGAAGGFIDYLGYPFCRGRVFAEVETDRGQYDDICDIFWATGACLMIRSDVFRTVGGLDDEFFAHMEEIDLCWRLRSRCYRIVCIPQSTVYHVGGGALHVEHPRKTYLNFRNNMLLLYKNLPAKKLKKIMFARFFLDYIAALQLLVTGKPANALSVFKARMDYHKMKKNFGRKRDENILYSTNTEIAEIFSESLILNYYFKNRKTFNKIIK